MFGPVRDNDGRSQTLQRAADSVLGPRGSHVPNSAAFPRPHEADRRRDQHLVLSALPLDTSAVAPSLFPVRRRIGGANHYFDFRSSPMFFQMETDLKVLNRKGANEMSLRLTSGAATSPRRTAAICAAERVSISDAVRHRVNVM
jgi:hypothetical protein